MARLALNKSSLSRTSRQLATYQRFLPSLDMKRRQLIGERAKARVALASTRKELAASQEHTGRILPMIANERIDLDGLVSIESFELGEENVVGTRLPTLAKMSAKVRPYSYFARPHWIDRLTDELKRVLELRLKIQVEEQRIEMLESAVRKVTQRVNLFDKVLIPRSREDIRRIKIYLSDTERAGVVTAKIAKKKQEAMRQ